MKDYLVEKCHKHLILSEDVLLGNGDFTPLRSDDSRNDKRLEGISHWSHELGRYMKPDEYRRYCTHLAHLRYEAAKRQYDMETIKKARADSL